jgi:hypothetical protein
MIGRRAVVLAVSAVVAGCAQSSSPGPETPPPATPAGIVVVSFEEPSSPVVGVIDPTSGRYSQGATLNISPQTFGVADRGTAKLAPDWSRYAVTRQVGDVPHAGWVDPQAKFTDVNAQTPVPGEGSVSFDAIGFDGMGNFFYRMTQNDQSTIYKLPNGQTSGGEAVPYLPSGADSGFKRDGAGRLVELPSCPTFAAEWVSPTDYLHVSADGTQIFRTKVAETPALRDCDTPVGTPLLPPTNNSQVSDPVASPDGTKVAYLRDGSELWTVDANGGNPVRVNVSGIDLASAKTTLTGWTAPTPSLNRPQDFSRKPDLAGTWSGDYFGPGLDGTGSVALHVDVSDPLSGSVFTTAGDLTCNNAAKETARTAQSLSVELTLKAGADPRCRGTSTVEFAWLGDRLSGVIAESSEPSYVGGTLIVRRP